MEKEIRIVIGGEECRAELLVEEAPHICAAIVAALPLNGVLSHAKLVDREVFFPIPFFIDEQENLKTSEKGDLAFWNGRQSVCIFFDDMVPLGATPTFGRITANLEGFQREAAKVWEAPGTKITFDRLSASAGRAEP
ncbi:MAG: cyclophilin-like fold protein [Anaerolineae bacterium]